MDIVLSGIAWSDGSSDHRCGTPECAHTIIQHGNHTGWLASGKLKCRCRVDEPLASCSLNLDFGECELVSLLDGHTHGPGCGHELVPHGKHYDYLVSGSLHHVVSSAGCCDRGCLGFLQPGRIVRHGHVDVLRERSPLLGRNRDDRELDEQDEGSGTSDAEGFITTYIFAAGICCPAEIPIIDKILKPLPGVESVDTMVVTKTVKVVHDASKVSPSAMVAALNDARLQATLGEKGGKTEPQKTPFPWHVLASGVLLIVSLLSFIDDSLEPAEWLALGAVAFGIPGVFLRAIVSIRNWMLDINVLMVIAVAGAIGIEEYHEAGAIVFLFGMAEWLETKCMGRARNAVNSLLEIQPDTAMSAVTQQLIPIEKVQVGDELIVRPGDRVPVDAVVVDGKSTLDESMLTGETRPVPKSVDDKVTSGTINCGNASLRIKATSTVDDSTVATLSKLVEQASLQKSQTARLVERFSTVYTPIVVASAAALVVVPLSIGVDNQSDWIYLALVLLLTACPCALVISTPITTICGISRAARQGILIKGGQYLEALARVKAITFDKTGTLTEGRFGVIAVEAFGKHNQQDVLEWAAALELHSTHPVGPAIVGCAAARGVAVKNNALGVETIPGMGISGVVDERTVQVGNMSLMRKAVPEYDFTKLELLEDKYMPQGASLAFVCVDDSVVGAIVVSDSVRTDAKQAVEKMHKKHLTVGMLTGDRKQAARLVAEQLGIPAEHTHAELVPEDKLTKVAEYRSTYGVEAHVGDGINDTLALARADVGVAMGIAGSAMAVEAADVALFTNDLMNLVMAVDISRKVHWIILENIVFAITLKVAVIALASMGHIRLWIAVVADVGSSILVVLNGLRLLKYQTGEKPAKALSSSEAHEDKVGAWKKFVGHVRDSQTRAQAGENVQRSILMMSPRTPGVPTSCRSGGCGSKGCSNVSGTGGFFKSLGAPKAHNKKKGCCGGNADDHGHDHAHGHKASSSGGHTLEKIGEVYGNSSGSDDAKGTNGTVPLADCKKGCCGDKAKK